MYLYRLLLLARSAIHGVAVKGLVEVRSLDVDFIFVVVVVDGETALVPHARVRWASDSLLVAGREMDFSFVSLDSGGLHRGAELGHHGVDVVHQCGHVFQ